MNLVNPFQILLVFTISHTSVTNYHNTETWIWSTLSTSSYSFHCPIYKRHQLAQHRNMNLVNPFQILLQFSLSHTQASPTTTTPKLEFGQPFPDIITIFTVPYTSVTNFHNTETWIWSTLSRSSYSFQCPIYKRQQPPQHRNMNLVNPFHILLQFSLSHTQASPTTTTPKHKFGETAYRQISADDLISNSALPLNIQFWGSRSLKRRALYCRIVHIV